MSSSKSPARKSRLAFAAALLLSAFTMGCGIDAAVDCHQICARYSSCFDAKYDVPACETRCRSASSTDTDYRRKADTCNACITDRACSSAVWSCGTECSAVVP